MTATTRTAPSRSRSTRRPAAAARDGAGKTRPRGRCSSRSCSSRPARPRCRNSRWSPGSQSPSLSNARRGSGRRSSGRTTCSSTAARWRGSCSRPRAGGSSAGSGSTSTRRTASCHARPAPPPLRCGSPRDGRSTAAVLLAAVLDELEGRYGQWLADGLAGLGEDLERRNALRGVRVHAGGRSGTAGPIAADGRLTVAARRRQQPARRERRGRSFGCPAETAQAPGFSRAPEALLAAQPTPLACSR